LKFTPCRARKASGIPPSADGGKGAALDPPAFFYEKKAGRKNLSCLWQALIGRSDPQTLIYRGLHNTALLLYSYHKVKARSGTKVAVISNRYATDKRAAAAANSDLA